MSPRLFRTATLVALGVTLTFLALPLVSMFVRVPPGSLLRALGSDEARSALAVSLRANAIAMAILVVVGTPAAYAVATRSFRGRRAVIALIELPLVLPPAVAGIALLAAFGRRGLLGPALEDAGAAVSFTHAAVVLAIVFVSSPFYLRQAIAAFEGVDPDAVDAARTLGASPQRVFSRIALPAAAGGLGAGAALALARGLGEFGATIMFAGSLRGTTRTLPLAIYAELGRNLDAALAMGAVLVVASAVILFAVKGVRWTRSPSTSG